MNKNAALDLIAVAFANRQKPIAAIRVDAPDTDEYQDASNFTGRDWTSIACSDFEKWPAAISGFTPEAFVYYLPAILSASMREMRSDLIAVDGIIYMLDRSNSPSTWDDFFVERWCGLTSEECYAVQHWITWLTESDPEAFTEGALSRSMDTLDMISNIASATPLALR